MEAEKQLEQANAVPVPEYKAPASTLPMKVSAAEILAYAMRFVED